MKLPQDPRAIDWTEFEKVIQDFIHSSTIQCPSCAGKSTGTRTEPNYLFIEGFLLFQPHVLRYFDIKIFLSISRETCYERRMSTTPVPENYFSELVWPGYLKHNQFILEMKDVLILDGEAEKESIKEKAKTYIVSRDVKTDPAVFERLQVILSAEK
jgi:uridine kinase